MCVCTRVRASERVPAYIYVMLLQLHTLCIHIKKYVNLCTYICISTHSIHIYYIKHNDRVDAAVRAALGRICLCLSGMFTSTMCLRKAFVQHDSMHISI